MEHRHGSGWDARDAAGSHRRAASWQVSQNSKSRKALAGKLNTSAALYYFKEAGYVHDFVPFERPVFVQDQANDVTNTDVAAFIHATTGSPTPSVTAAAASPA